MKKYRGLVAIYGKYWDAYGGWREFFRSPYLHASLVLTVLTYGTWSEPQWWEGVLDIIPDLLGFTLGGFAVFLAFGDEKFRALIGKRSQTSGGGKKSSLYVRLSAAFMHFIFMQIIALVYALAAKGLWVPFGWPDWAHPDVITFMNLFGAALGYGIFIYAVFCGLAAAMYIFRVSNWYESHQESLCSKNVTKSWIE